MVGGGGPSVYSFMYDVFGLYLACGLPLGWLSGSRSLGSQGETLVGSPGFQRLSRCRPFLCLGVQSLLRHRSLLGALVFRDFYVAARSWALVLRTCYVTALWGVLVSRACYVTARCWEPWCYLASLGLLGGLLGALLEPFWGPLGTLLAVLGPFWAVLGTFWAVL